MAITKLTCSGKCSRAQALVRYGLDPDHVWGIWTISSRENQVEAIRDLTGGFNLRWSASGVLRRAGDVGYSHSAIEEVEQVPVELPWLFELAGVPGADEGDQLGVR